ncbi:MAG: N-acetylmuramoyl-L-alanine amidase [Candidatus Sulfotelmatobacter sp.]
MGTTPTKTQIELPTQLPGSSASPWPRSLNPSVVFSSTPSQDLSQRPCHRDALQALLAFSALHEQVRRRKALAVKRKGFELVTPVSEFESGELFVLDDVLQLVAERAVAITGADGLAIALAENNEIVLRASAGVIKPDVGARIDRDSAFSGACFRLAQIIRCDDTEADERVNLHACRRLGARSMVAVPLCGRRRVIGLLEAFSSDTFGFNDSDVHSLELLAELVLGALKPEDEDRFAESAEAAASTLVVEPVKATSDAPPTAKIDAPAVKEAFEELTAAVTPVTGVDEEAILDEPLFALAPQAAASAPTTAEEDEAVLEEPEPAPTATMPTRDEPERLPEQTAVPDFAAGEPGVSRHPGALVVLVLVVIAALSGAGWWWKAKNAQIGKGMVRSLPKAIAKATGSGAPTQNPVAPSGLSASTIPATGSATLEAGIPAEAAGAGANPQELSKLPRVTGIRHWSSADSSTVVLDLQDQVQYEAHRLAGPDRIYFDLHDTALAPDLVGKIIDVGDALLTRIRVAQPVPGMTRVVLETKGNPNFSVSLEPNPYRLVVEVRKIGADPKAKIDLFPGAAETEKEKMAIVVPPPTREDLQLRAKAPKMRIVVDAGHGGWDLGTVGRRGLLEKDVVLEIAQRLGKLLESRLGAEVILTRNDDNYIPLDQRASIANQAQADLFVSVHANYSDLPSARGVETYYTNFFVTAGAKDADAHDSAAPEEVSGSKSAVAATLSPAELHEKIEQSRRLAASVQRSLYGTLAGQNPGLRDRGVKEASYVVLTETAMPGILAEVSFVSSPTDEQKLRSDGYREHIAEALYKGIAHYAVNSRGVKMASAAKQ